MSAPLRLSKCLHRSLLLAGTAIAGWSFSGAAALSQGTDCSGGRCAAVPMAGAKQSPVADGNPAAAAKTGREGRGRAERTPFVISVDGQVLDRIEAPARKGDRRPSRDASDAVDGSGAGLDAVQIDIRYDGLAVGPLLGLSMLPERGAHRAGDTVRFLPVSNYPGFIAQAEIRVLEVEEGWPGQKLVATLPVELNREAAWTVPATEPGRLLRYVLRVYDAQGRFDETQPRSLSQDLAETDPLAELKERQTGVAEDQAAIRNIPIRGGGVTISGHKVPPGFAVEAMGEHIAVDRDRGFLLQRILPPGTHDIGVAIEGESGNGGLTFSRDINIPENDWFYVGLADLTVGKRSGDAGIEQVRPGEYDEVYTKGRLAFYLKGKIRGKYLLTAAADTGEDDIENLFRNLNEKDPRQLLRRLDPDDYYPVYGDDSTFVEDAPTKGKFYVRVDRGDSHVMWGNYKTSITGTEFLRQERSLYGANAAYRPEASTSFGERRTEITAYAAQPDTLPQREEFLATGGSAYFLKRQDIVEGSETITVEIRDSISGHVEQRQTLRYGSDYTLDYLQGVLILKRPLSSAAAGNGPVRDGALGGNRIYLIAQYEYTPIGDVDGFALGGRAQQWVNDRVRVGVTGMSETTGEADQRALGADLRIRHSETTFLDAEVAHSKGPGFGFSQSTDGGLTSHDSAVAGRPGQAASAWRFRGQLDLQDVSDAKGTVGGYYEEKQAGFSTLYDQLNVDKRIWGVDADVALTERVATRLTYDDFSDDAGQVKREGTSSVSYQWDEYWKISFGVSYTELMSPLAIASGKRGYDGSRLDAGLRVDYRFDEDRLVYVFGQGTLSRSGDISRNDRLGLGGEARLTQTIGAKAEVSYGTHGLGGLAALTYDPNADDHYYLGYKLDPDRAFELDRRYDLVGTDKGALVAGVKRRLGDTASAYAETNYDLFGRRNTLTQTYGVVYTPDAVWTFDAGFETGRIRDDTIDRTGKQQSDFDRFAPSLSIGYKDEERGIAARLRGEVRIEDSEDGTRDQNTYLVAAGVSWKTSEDWRVLASVEAVISDATSPETSFQDTDYVETSLGYAYRPVDNDRLNMLFKYSWLYDMPGNNRSVSGSIRDVLAPAQRSHIVSADFTYDLLPWLSVGGKYGARFGEVRYRTDGGTGSAFEDEWQKSTAHLGVARADFHIVKQWDILAEGRVLHMPQARTTDFGALLALYRHVGDNFKLGLGYNFGRFSDDLRDLTLDDRGVFLNVVGKF